jgi:hypothetical protein
MCNLNSVTYGGRSYTNGEVFMAKHSSHFRWRFKGTKGRQPETYQQFVERRFWSKVEKGDGCWLWQAAVRRRDGRNAYGQFFLDGRNVSAHRMALMFEGTILRDSDVVAHRCDNPQCVRPDHLFVTTNQGNTADREAKGRGAKLERNGNAKLSDADVRELRAAYADGMRPWLIAKKWNISYTHAKRLVENKMRKEQRPLP